MKHNKTIGIISASIIGVIFLVSVLIGVISPSRSYLRKLRSAMDIENPTTRKFSLKLAATYPGPYNIDQVCKIYEYIYNNWKYVNDPRGNDYLSKASLTIDNNFTGDCDDFAILIATAIESINGKTRISCVIDSATGEGHAFTEVYFKEEPQIIQKQINYHFQKFFDKLFGISRVKTICYTPDGEKGNWLNLDWSSKYPGGRYIKYSKRIIYYPMENYYIPEIRKKANFKN